jgi:hypothetical protein
MTAPLHHINQLYLHLPAINGQVAACDAVERELRVMAQKAQDERYRRDLVELVAETGASAESAAIHPGRDPLGKVAFKDKPKVKAKAAVRSPGLAKGQAGDANTPLVSVRV